MTSIVCEYSVREQRVFAIREHNVQHMIDGLIAVAMMDPDWIDPRDIFRSIDFPTFCNRVLR